MSYAIFYFHLLVYINILFKSPLRLIYNSNMGLVQGYTATLAQILEFLSEAHHNLQEWHF